MITPSVLGQLGPVLGALTGALEPEGAPAAAAHAVTALSGAPAAGPWWAMLIPGLPLLGVVLVTLCACLRVRSKLPALLSLVCLGGAFVLTAVLYAQMSEPGAPALMLVKAWEWINLSWGDGPGQRLTANFAFYIDSLTLLWMLFVSGLGTVIGLYSMEYVSHDVGPGYCRYFAAFNLFVFSMSCLVMADNLLFMFLGWEGVGLCSYLLIGYHYQRPEAVAAAKKAFIVNRIGDLGLLMGMLCIFVVFGTLEYKPLFDMITAGVDGSGNTLRNSWVVTVVPLLLTAGAFGKSAQLFFYVWLPDAMEGPTPVSALIHAATMVTAGVFLIARTYPVFTADPGLSVLTFVAWSGAITAAFSATIGMAVFDIKRVMGYSTISQLGFMFAGLGLLTPTGAAFHTLTHAFFKATLFLSVGAVMHGFAGQLDLRRLSGVMKVGGFGLVGLAMLVGSLNLAGVPGLPGYFSKDMILAQGFTTPTAVIPGAGAIGWVLLFTAGLTAYYTFRVFFRVFTGPVNFTPGDDPVVLEHGRHPKGQPHAAHAPHADHADHAHAGGHDGHGSHAPAAVKPFDPATEDFTPHAPGWAMRGAIALCAVLSIVSTALYFLPAPPGEPAPPGGWVGGMIARSSAVFESPEYGHVFERAGQSAQPAAFFGFNPHDAMFVVSAGVGILGILIAALLHGPRGAGGLFFGNRERADVAPRADALGDALGGVAVAARHKWYVDEIYNALIRIPLLVLAHLFHAIDKLLVDGLVDLFGRTPRGAGAAAQNAQTGVLHGYAFGMAAGLALLALLALFVAT